MSQYVTNVGGWSSFDKYPRYVADVNGDGKDDVVGFGETNTFVGLSDGSSFGAPATWIHQFTPSAGGWSSFNKYPRMMADVNGDGKADIVAFGLDHVYVALSTGSSFSGSTVWHNLFNYNGGGWTSYDKYPRAVVDVNGDGKADIVGFGESHTYVSLSTGSSFGAPATWINHFTPSAGGWSSYDKYPRVMADVNGDSKADIVAFGLDHVYVALSTGSSFSGGTVWHSNFNYNGGGWTSQNTYPRTVVDINGDGKADIVGFGKDHVYTGISSGYGFGMGTLPVESYVVNKGGWSSFDTYPRCAGDVTGNGKADIVGFGADAVYVTRSI